MYKQQILTECVCEWLPY